MRVLDVGLCSDRCKLKEVVSPFGKCGDRVYKGMREREGERGGMSCEKDKANRGEKFNHTFLSLAKPDYFCKFVADIIIIQCQWNKNT